MSIMLSPEPQGNNRVAPGWSANDLTPDDIAEVVYRFVRHFEPGHPDECWLWTASRTTTGYGQIQGPARSTLLAHRVAWVAFTGQSLTDQMTIDHLCSNKICVNPDHLEPVTLHENARRRNERLGFVIGGKTRRKSDRPYKRRTDTRTPIRDEEDRKQRARANSLAYYRENREKILARQRANPRPFRRVTCDDCGLELRSDGLRRHIRRMHPEVV